RKPGKRLFRRRDVTAPDDWDGNRALHRRYYIPVSVAAVAFRAWAPMYGHTFSATVLDQPGNFNCVYRRVIPAGADLHRQRDRNRFSHAAQNLLELRQIPNNRRPAPS